MRSLTPFRHREVSDRIAEMAVGLLKMQWNGIVKSRLDTCIFKLLPQGLAIVALNNIKMVDMPPVIHLNRKCDGVAVEQTRVLGGCSAALIVPAIQVLELYR